MDPQEKLLENLLDALKFSPENIPLRLQIGQLCLDLNKTEEAIQHFQDTLALSPEDKGIKFFLAVAYYQHGKDDPAFVIVEELLDDENPSPAVNLLHAKLLLDDKQIAAARKEYEYAISIDSDLRDPELANEINQAENPTQAITEDGRIRLSMNEEDYTDLKDDISVERPSIDFEDVGGMESVKEEIRLKIIHPLNHADLYKQYGKSIGGGILMYGPPGCGKTHLARATAGEIKASFISVGINDVLDMWIGSSERNLHSLFESARDHSPAVLFFDEVDALGASRKDMKRAAGRPLINQFLAELDGIESSNEGVLILAATNTPWNMDSAFRRPGRFDRIIFVPPPDGLARVEILQILLREKPKNPLDLAAVAKNTRQFSGADLRAVVDIAVEAKISESLKSGKLAPLETKDLLKAVKQVKPSTREWFNSAKNYALYSNQGGLYDDIVKYLKL